MKLHAKIEGNWKMVFCRGRGLGNKNDLVTTENIKKALGGESLPYFQQHFPEIEFRNIKKFTTVKARSGAS